MFTLVVILYILMLRLVNLKFQNGQMVQLYYWLNNSVFGITDFWKPILNLLLSNDIFVSLLTYGVLILETFLFLAFMASIKYRRRILPIAILFHFSIIIFHGIFSFFFSITACLILFLYPTYQNINFKKYLL